MAAVVQTYPQQTSTIAMLQAQPTATVGIMSQGQGQAGHQYMGNSSQTTRAAYPNANGHTGYRGGSGPIQPYAFTSRPNLNHNGQWQQHQPQQQYGAQRTISSPAVPGAQTFDPSMYRGRQQHSPQLNASYASAAGYNQMQSRDDSVLQPTRNLANIARPHSAYLASTSSAALSMPTKPAAERYRRPSGNATHTRSASATLPATLATSNTSQNQQGANVRQKAPNSQMVPAGASKDDMHLHQQAQEEAKRLQRRSMRSVDTGDSFKVSQEVANLADSLFSDVSHVDAKTIRLLPSQQAHSRSESSESVGSMKSSHSRPSSATNRGNTAPTTNPSLSVSPSETTSKQEQSKQVNVPPRASSTDAAKRAHNPSPLSGPVTMPNQSTKDTPATASGPSYASVVASNLESPAAKQLAALNQTGGKGKSKTSRLRRAFSFGSAAELRKAAGVEEKVEPSTLHKDPSPSTDEVYDAEQERIAEAQEAAGIGNSIYGSRFFGGSTDNLSISSTASSASIMIRKMGRGMKKSTRSLVGLFRPKSIIGDSSAEALAPEASHAEVSMITVEAETQRVNVNPDPHATTGGTGFPHLERNSMDAGQVPDMIMERLGSSGTDRPGSRRSIVGGDRERAEVLAAVRKGILKRSSSPSIRQVDGAGLALPGVPAIADSPSSSAPSTPNDEAQGHRRTGSIALGNEDYFMTALRLRQDTKSAPTTPHGTVKRNATFSPRLIFHDTWPSQEYDRRGEVATCNRLTPMLAQQIKEELNSFKMEMEVHENSKIYTHFF